MSKLSSFAIAVVLALACFLSPAEALDLSGRSRTMFQPREGFNSTRIMPLFEFLDFRAEDVGDKSVSFHFGGWLRYDLRDDSVPGKDKNSDLQYAYLRIRGEQADAALDLGRVLVNEGVASEQLDGAYARTTLLGGFTVAAFGGVPVETDFDDRSGDSVYGGRLSHGAGGVYRIGLSYLKEKNGAALNNGSEVSRVFREEEGVDLWFRPFGKMQVLGSSFYNAVTDAWMYHSYYMLLGPFGGLRLTAQGGKVNYEDYFTSSTTSAFLFDPAVIDPREKLTTAGGEIAYRFDSGMTLSGEYTRYGYEIAGDAKRFGGGLSWLVLKKGAFGVTYHRMDGETASLQYDEYRGYVTKMFGAFDLTADYLTVRYDTEINGIRTASAAALAGGYTLSDTLRLVADVQYGRNPFFDKEVQGVLKVVTSFDLAGPAASAPAPKGKARRTK